LLKKEMASVGSGTMRVSRTIGPNGQMLSHGGSGGRGGFFSHHGAPGGNVPHFAGGTAGGGGGGGFWELIGAGVVAEVVKDVFSAGGDLETQKQLLRNKLGTRGTEDDINAATAAAIKYATGGPGSVMGATPASALKGIDELIAVTPNLKAAIDLYGPMARAAKVLEELTGQSSEDTMKTLAKGIENTGGGINPNTGELDPARMQEAVNAAVKTIIAGSGFIDASTLFGYAKQAGGMGRITTNLDAAQDEVITALIDMGGNRTGTAMAALGRQFLGDKMTFPTASSLSDLGLMPGGHWRKGGTGIIMDEGYDINGVDEIKDPAKGMGAWLNDYWAPAVKKKFEKEGKEFNPGNIMQESYKDFGQATGQRLALMFLMNKAQQDRDIAIRHGVDPAAAYSGIGDQDLGANIRNVRSAAKGFMEVFGSASVHTAIGGLHLLTDALHAFTSAASISPVADRSILGAAFGPAMFGNVYNAVKDFISHLKPSAPVQAPPPIQGLPMHPSGMGPQDRNYPRQGGSGSSPPPVNVRTTILLDGKVLADAVSHGLGALSTFPNQAAAGDTYGSWVAPDYNTAAG
jgi:hypothetical protein